jgi:hypothetical protein
MFQALQLPELRDLYRVDSFSFNTKQLKPLQAADLVAYEIFKHTENQIIDRGARPQRRSALNLFRSQDGRYSTLWDKDRIQDWLADCDKESPFGTISVAEAAQLKR